MKALYRRYIFCGALAASVGAMPAKSSCEDKSRVHPALRSFITHKKKMPPRMMWMSALSNHIPIGDVNLAGSHDCAAIISKSGGKPSPWDRQAVSIGAQLRNGIRVLDVRIAIIRTEIDDKEQYQFITTHDVGNHYQSFESLLDECHSFLKENRSEFVVLNFQVDEGDRTDPKALAALQNIINSDRYPLLVPGRDVSGMPTVGESRGKFVLLNRVTGDNRFGLPLPEWVAHQNCAFLVANRPSSDGCSVVVQDKFKELGQGVAIYRDLEQKKYELMTAAWNQFRRMDPGTVLINYASISHKHKVLNTKPLLLEQYNSLLEWRGQARYTRLGWVMFDFTFNTLMPTENGEHISVVDLMIASNVGYSDLEE